MNGQVACKKTAASQIEHSETFEICKRTRPLDNSAMGKSIVH
jgi:hypothetical protein